MKLLSLDFWTSWLNNLFKNIFLSLFIYLSFFFSRRFPELYLSTHLLRFSYHTYIFLIFKIPFCFLNVFYKGFLFLFHECSNPSQSFWSVLLSTLSLIPNSFFSLSFFFTSDFQVGIFPKITGRLWISVYMSAGL